MAPKSLTILCSLLLLQITLHLANAHQTQVVVEGKVYCQACDRFGTWSLTGAEPIASAKVSVICKDQKNRVSYYKVYETDQNGYFYGLLREFRMVNPFLDHPLQACRVRLVESPVEKCNLLSNVNYGLNGSPLRFDGKVMSEGGYEAVVYAAGPLAFRSDECSGNN